jgi:hypothetical protein
MSRSRRDTGASLLMAFIFLTVVAVIVMGLLRMTGAALPTVAQFNTAQSLRADIVDATNMAITNVNNHFTAGSLSTPLPTCINPTAFTASYAPSGIDVYCSTVWEPWNTVTRTVTFYACPGTEGETTCLASPWLKATAQYGDIPVPPSKLPLFAACTPQDDSGCGGGWGVQITSWLVYPNP